MLIRRPSHCLNCSLVVTKSQQWFIALSTPNKQLIIIPSWAKHLLIWRPLQSTNLLLMPLQTRNELLWISQISIQNTFISRTTAEQRRTPTQSSHSILMPYKGPYSLHFVDIPNLNISWLASDCDVWFSYSPAHRCHILTLKIAESIYLTSDCVPKINAWRESNS